MTAAQVTLKHEVQKLAEEAFHRKLISGYGDGPIDGEFQIVYGGKDRHFPLRQAYFLLDNLVHQTH